MMDSANKSRIRDDARVKAGSQGVKSSKNDFSSRLRDAIGALPRAAVARMAGVSTSSLDRWVKGATPDPESALALADALSVNYRWLIKGVGAKAVDLTPEANPGSVILPKYDLAAFTEEFRPGPTEHLAVRIDWLNRITRATNGIWLADMPSDAMPNVAREGDTLICQDTSPPLIDGRTYLFLIRGDVVVRRLQITPDGLLLRSDDPERGTVLIEPGQTDIVTPVARVLGAMSLRSV